MVLISTGVAIAVGVPLGILLTRYKRLQTPILGIANVMQTVPSLALFGLLIPIPFIGGIGARTAIIALALYALLPVIRNTVTGILGIDPKIRDAAVAMGMTDWQRLKMVELPLAMPVILTHTSCHRNFSWCGNGRRGRGCRRPRDLHLSRPEAERQQFIDRGCVGVGLLALLFDFALGQFEKSYESANVQQPREGDSSPPASPPYLQW